MRRKRARGGIAHHVVYGHGQVEFFAQPGQQAQGQQAVSPKLKKIRSCRRNGHFQHSGIALQHHLFQIVGSLLRAQLAFTRQNLSRGGWLARSGGARLPVCRRAVSPLMGAGLKGAGHGRFNRAAAGFWLHGGLQGGAQASEQKAHSLKRQSGWLEQKAEAQLLAGYDRNTKRIGNFFKPAHVVQHYPAAVKGRVYGVVFKNHQMVQHIPAHAGQRHIAKAHLLQALLFHRRQQGGQGHSLIPAHAQGQGLDEQAHRAVHAREFRRAARRDHAKNHIAARGVCRAKHKSPQRLHHHRQGHGRLRGGRLQPRRELRVQRQLFGFRVGIGWRGVGPGGKGHSGCSGKAPQQFGPVVKGGTFIKARAPAGVVFERKGRGKLPPAAAARRAAKGEQLAQQNAHAPAVHEQMVETPGHDQPVRPKAEKLRPQQGAFAHVENLVPPQPQQGCHFLACRLLRQT